MTSEATWKTVSGYIAGDELHKETMTIDQAKLKCKELEGCFGFYYSGGPDASSDEAIEIIFCSGAEVQEATFTTYTTFLLTEEKETLDIDDYDAEDDGKETSQENRKSDNLQPLDVDDYDQDGNEGADQKADAPVDENTKVANEETLDLEDYDADGDGTPEREAAEREAEDKARREAAATKIQKLQRGKVGRTQASSKKEDAAKREAAATKIQKLHRGNVGRTQASSKKQEKADLPAEKEPSEDDVDDDEAQAKKAAALLDDPSAAEREAEDAAKRDAAATKIQKLHRGNAARTEASSKRQQKTDLPAEIGAAEEEPLGDDDDVSQARKKEVAATKIQKLHRGNVGRSQASDKKRQVLNAKISNDAPEVREFEQKSSFDDQDDEETRAKKEAAAIKIQKVQRGKVGREEVRGKPKDRPSRDVDERKVKANGVATNDTDPSDLVSDDDVVYSSDEANAGKPMKTDSSLEDTRFSSMWISLVADESVTKLGFTFDRTLEVQKVTTGGWADNEGIEEGDQIMRINGRRASDLSPEEIKTMMDERPLKLKMVQAEQHDAALAIQSVWRGKRVRDKTSSQLSSAKNAKGQSQSERERNKMLEELGVMGLTEDSDSGVEGRGYSAESETESKAARLNALRQKAKRGLSQALGDGTLETRMEEHKANQRASPMLGKGAGGSLSRSPLPERRVLLQKLFRLCDIDEDGFLNEKELLIYARNMHYPGDSDVWSEDYGDFCEEFGWNANKGINGHEFLELANNIECDFFCSDEDLGSILNNFQTFQDARVHLEEDEESQADSDDLTAQQTIKLQRKRTPKHKIVRARDDYETQPSIDLIEEVFKLLDVNKDEHLNQREMLRFVRCLDYPGDAEGWGKEYKALCRYHEWDPAYGIDFEGFVTLVDDNDDNYFLEVEQMQNLLLDLEHQIAVEALGHRAAEAPGGRVEPGYHDLRFQQYDLPMQLKFVLKIDGLDFERLDAHEDMCADFMDTIVAEFSIMTGRDEDDIHISMETEATKIQVTVETPDLEIADKLTRDLELSSGDLEIALAEAVSEIHHIGIVKKGKVVVTILDVSDPVPKRGGRQTMIEAGLAAMSAKSMRHFLETNAEKPAFPDAEKKLVVRSRETSTLPLDSVEVEDWTHNSATRVHRPLRRLICESQDINARGRWPGSRRVLTRKLVAEFKEDMLRRELSLASAWRRCIDPEWRVRISQTDFCEAMRRIGYRGQYRALWRELDVDRSGTVTFTEFDWESAATLGSFYNKIMKRYGSVEVAATKWGIHGPRRCHLKEFLDELIPRGFVVGQNDGEMLFYMLADTPFGNPHNLENRSPAVQAVEMQWLAKIGPSLPEPALQRVSPGSLGKSAMQTFSATPSTATPGTMIMSPGTVSSTPQTATPGMTPSPYMSTPGTTKMSPRMMPSYLSDDTTKYDSEIEEYASDSGSEPENPRFDKLYAEAKDWHASRIRMYGLQKSPSPNMVANKMRTQLVWSHSQAGHVNDEDKTVRLCVETKKYHCDSPLEDGTFCGRREKGSRDRPQCASCQRFQEAYRVNEAMAPVLLDEKTKKYYCGRKLGRVQIPRSDKGICGPDDNPKCPQCDECKKFQAYEDAKIKPEQHAKLFQRLFTTGAKEDDPKVGDVVKLEEILSLSYRKKKIRLPKGTKGEIVALDHGNGRVRIKFDGSVRRDWIPIKEFRNMTIFTQDGRRKKRIRHIDGTDMGSTLTEGASSPDSSSKASPMNADIWNRLWEKKKEIGVDHTEKSTNLAFRQEAVLEGLSIQELMAHAAERAGEIGDTEFKAWGKSRCDLLEYLKKNRKQLPEKLDDGEVVKKMHVEGEKKKERLMEKAATLARQKRDKEVQEWQCLLHEKHNPQCAHCIRYETLKEKAKDLAELKKKMEEELTEAANKCKEEGHANGVNKPHPNCPHYKKWLKLKEQADHFDDWRYLLHQVFHNTRHDGKAWGRLYEEGKKHHHDKLEQHTKVFKQLLEDADSKGLVHGRNLMQARLLLKAEFEHDPRWKTVRGGHRDKLIKQGVGHFTEKRHIAEERGIPYGKKDVSNPETFYRLHLDGKTSQVKREEQMRSKAIEEERFLKNTSIHRSTKSNPGVFDRLASGEYVKPPLSKQAWGKRRRKLETDWEREVHANFEKKDADAEKKPVHMLLFSFPRAPWPPPQFFESELRCNLEILGSPDMTYINVRLREGHPGVTAEVRGGEEELEKFHQLDLGRLVVTGIPVVEVWSQEAQEDPIGDFVDFISEKFESLEEAFKSMEVKNSGTINRSDFVRVCKTKGFTGNLTFVWHALSSGHNHLSMPDWMQLGPYVAHKAAMVRLPHSSDVRHMHGKSNMRPAGEFALAVQTLFGENDAAYEHFNPNGGQPLSFSEFQAVARSIGWKGDCKEVFKEMDVHRKGRVGKEEFRQLKKILHEESAMGRQATQRRTLIEMKGKGGRATIVIPGKGGAAEVGTSTKAGYEAPKGRAKGSRSILHTGPAQHHGEHQHVTWAKVSPQARQSVASAPDEVHHQLEVLKKKHSIAPRATKSIAISSPTREQVRPQAAQKSQRHVHPVAQQNPYAAAVQRAEARSQAAEARSQVPVHGREAGWAAGEFHSPPPAPPSALLKEARKSVSAARASIARSMQQGISMEEQARLQQQLDAQASQWQPAPPSALYKEARRSVAAPRASLFQGPSQPTLAGLSHDEQDLIQQRLDAQWQASPGRASLKSHVSQSDSRRARQSVSHAAAPPPLDDFSNAAQENQDQSAPGNTAIAAALHVKSDAKKKGPPPPPMPPLPEDFVARDIVAEKKREMMERKQQMVANHSKARVSLVNRARESAANLLAVKSTVPPNPRASRMDIAANAAMDWEDRSSESESDVPEEVIDDMLEQQWNKNATPARSSLVVALQGAKEQS